MPVNQRWNRFEPFAKRAAATRKNGVVGRNGSTMPTAPRPVQRNASPTHVPLIIFFIRTSYLTVITTLRPFACVTSRRIPYSASMESGVITCCGLPCISMLPLFRPIISSL